MARNTGVWSAFGGLLALSVLPACDGPEPWTYAPSAVAGGPTQGGGAGSPGTAPTITRSGLPPMFAGKTERASAKIAPIAGGTLLVTKDGKAIVSDPDRDQVHVVDLATQAVASVALQERDEPGRAVEGPAGTVYVAARRGGVVLAVDTASASATRIPVCAAPRGIAYDAPRSKLYVACRSGVLAEIDAQGSVSARHRLDADLRDVLLVGEELVVTRFKTAEVLVVDRAGKLLRRSAPEYKPGLSRNVSPTVAFRALGAPGGGVLVGHVSSSNDTLPSGAGAYYGAPCGGSVADLSVAVMSPNGGADGTTLTTLAANRLGNASGPLDLAVSPDGARIALLASGNSWTPPNGQPKQNLWLTSHAELSSGTFNLPCAGVASNQPASWRVPGEPVAVAFDTAGKWVVQSRQPAQLQLESGAVIALAADSRFDTGFALFHMNTGGGIACSSCHPEAGEDGHTWKFSVGPRRSQTLEGGASKRAPFHWSGDLGNFDALIDEVMMKRMSLLADIDESQRGALRDWVDSVPKAPTADDLDPDAVERGRALFNDAELACAKCHSGPDFSDNLAHDVGTGAAFITPSLIDVNMRAPLFHDGCAATLAGRFGPCGGGDAHGVTSKLTRADEADLVAFMQSL